jgi:hypothetical protein
MRSRAEAPRHPGRFSMRSLEHALDGLPLYGGNAFVHFKLPITHVLTMRTIRARPEENPCTFERAIFQTPPGLFRVPSLLGEL